MRRLSRRISIVAVSLAAVSLFAGGAVASPQTPMMVISGRGLDSLHLGARQSSAIAMLERLLGRATTNVAATPDLTNCGVSAQGSWHSLSVFFLHDRLVGLAFGPGHTPRVRTDLGLQLGDTLARARTLYGKRLTTSGNNGGAWFAKTSVGRLDGFLSPSGTHAQRPSSRILTIGVGVVGCPSMSP